MTVSITATVNVDVNEQIFLRTKSCNSSRGLRHEGCLQQERTNYLGAS